MPSESHLLFFAALALAPIGLVLRASLRLVYGARGPAENDAAHLSTSVMAWVMIVISLCVAAVSTFGFFLVILAVVAYSALDIVLARRAQQKQLAWSIVSSAAGRKLPIVEAADVNAQRFTGRMRRRFDRFTADLKAGFDVREAIARHRRLFPRTAQGIAALAKQGELTLLDAKKSNSVSTERAGSGPRQNWSGIYGPFYYLLMLCVLATMILAFLFVRIIPEFRKMFEELGFRLPVITQVLLSAGESDITRVLGFLLLLSYPLLAIVLTGCWLAYLIGYDPLRPIGDRLLSSYRRAEVLQLLAVAASRAESFEETLDNLIGPTPRFKDSDHPPPSRMPRIDSGVFRKRLRHALELATSGVDWRDALRRARIIRSNEAPLLHAAERAGNLPWALQAIADRAVSNSLFRWQAVLRIVYPLLTITAGVVVGWIVIALFLPLVEIIDGLT